MEGNIVFVDYELFSWKHQICKSVINTRTGKAAPVGRPFRCRRSQPGTGPGDGGEAAQCREAVSSPVSQAPARLPGAAFLAPLTPIGNRPRRRFLNGRRCGMPLRFDKHKNSDETDSGAVETRTVSHYNNMANADWRRGRPRDFRTLSEVFLY